MTKIQKLKNYLVVLLMVFAVFFMAVPVFAAELVIDSNNQEIRLDDQFEASLFLNTEGEDINAIEGRIIFPADLLELQEIRDGNSIINFWIERPKLEQAGIVGFSGIIPGGYQDAKGFLLSVVFQAKTSGNGAIEIRDAKVLLNDGKGTLAKTTIFNFQFSISKEDPTVPPIVEIIKDTNPPEDFKPEIAQSPEMFEGKWFLVFATQDKGSGIAYYAIRETRRKTIRETDAKWTEAESPYVLKDQNLRSYICVKAVDKAGNERIAVVEPRYPIKWHETWWIWSIIGIILAIVIGFLIRRFLWKRYTKIHK